MCVFSHNILATAQRTAAAAASRKCRGRSVERSQATDGMLSIRTTLDSIESKQKKIDYSNVRNSSDNAVLSAVRRLQRRRVTCRACACVCVFYE